MAGALNWKGPFGSEYWENRAANAWGDLGYPAAHPAPSIPSQNDLSYDAFRHAYTQADWTRRFGEDVARAGGDQVERDNSWNFRDEKGLRDMRGDLFNNEIGRQIGKNAPEGLTDRELAERIIDALQKGQLVTDKQNDPRALAENFLPA